MNAHRTSVSFLFALVALTLGCDEESSTPAGEVIYEAGATDEALDALLAKTAEDVAAEAAYFTWPVDGDMLPKNDPLSFWFELTAEEARLEAPASKNRHASVGPRPFEPTFGLGRLSPALLPPLWSFPLEAKAHGTPISGRAYYLVASTQDNPNLLRVFTTDVTFEPDEAAMDVLRGAGSPITVEVLNAVFEENRVVEGGGPFKGIPITIEFID